MKLTNKAIKQFEAEQEEYGTRVALVEFVWRMATDILKDVGIMKADIFYGRKRLDK